MQEEIENFFGFFPFERKKEGMFFHFRACIFYLGYFFKIGLAIRKKNSYNNTEENHHEIGDNK